MSLLHPGIFFAGLAAVALPVIVHLLLRRRRRPQPWGAMRFLVEAYRRQRRRLRFEQWVLFALRCLVIVLAATALARPLFGGSANRGGGGATTLYLLVDDSIAGALQDGDAEALTRHTARARDLLASLDPARGDRAALIPLSAPAEALVLPASADLGAVRTLLADLSPTDAAADIAGAFKLVAQDAESAGAGPIRVALLSDLFAGATDLGAALPALPARAQLLAPASPERSASNIAVTRVSPLRAVVVRGRALPGEASAPGTSAQAVVELERVITDSPERVRVRLEAERAGAPAILLGEREAAFAAGAARTTVSFTADLGAVGAREARGATVLVARVDPDRQPRDNVRRVTLTQRETLRVGVVATPRFGERPPIDAYTPGDWVRLALAPEVDDASLRSSRGRQVEPIDVPPGAVDAPRLAPLDAAIVAEPERVDALGWRALRDFASEGRLVVVFPARGESQRWAATFAEVFGVAASLAPDTPVRNASLERQPPAPAFGQDLLALVRAELPRLAGPVAFTRPLSITPSDETSVLWRFEDGAPFLIAEKPDDGAGLVTFFASALDLSATDLPAKPLVVPLLQEVVRQGVGAARRAPSAEAGAPLGLPQRVTEIRGMDGSLRPARSPARAPRRAGAYEALDATGATVTTTVVQPSAIGARTEALPPAEVSNWLAAAAGEGMLTDLDGDGAEARTDPTAGAQLAAFLLLAAAALAACEAVVARAASHAGTTGAAA